MTWMLRTIELEGTPQERGWRHGQILGAEIRQVRRAFLSYLARLSLYAGAWPIFGGLLLLARRFLPYIPNHLKQELAAVAAGAQVSLGPWRWGRTIPPTGLISWGATWITRYSSTL